MSLKTGQTTLPQMIDEINRVAGKADAALNSDSIVQGVGQNTNKIMSQKAVTDALAEIGAGGAGGGVYIGTISEALANRSGAAGSIVTAPDGHTLVAGDLLWSTVDRIVKRISSVSGSGASAMYSLLPFGLEVVQTTGTSTINVMSQNAVNNALSSYLLKNGGDLKVGITAPNMVSGTAYLDCSISSSVYSGTYYFYNCTGTVTVSGTSAKVYAVNCPNLTINGKTTSNWQNIWIDGVASRMLKNTDTTLPKSSSTAATLVSNISDVDSITIDFWIEGQGLHNFTIEKIRNGSYAYEWRGIYTTFNLNDNGTLTAYTDETGGVTVTYVLAEIYSWR